MTATCLRVILLDEYIDLKVLVILCVTSRDLFGEFAFRLAGSFDFSFDQRHANHSVAFNSNRLTREMWAVVGCGCRARQPDRCDTDRPAAAITEDPIRKANKTKNRSIQNSIDYLNHQDTKTQIVYFVSLCLCGSKNVLETHFPDIPIRRDNSASRMWFGCARFSTVLLNNTINSSCSLLNCPVNGWSPIFVTTPSLTHCQNCVCVVQNCFRSRQTTSAVFFFRFFFLFV